MPHLRFTNDKTGNGKTSPNKGMQATAYSLRFASASRRA
jgi:hypothetical protein